MLPAAEIHSLSPNDTSRWANLSRLFSTPGPMASPDFEPMAEMFDMIREGVKLLVIGAGGLGCELLKDLAMSGFKVYTTTHLLVK